MTASAPRQTHAISRHGDLITKTYRSWGRGEHLREWQVLQALHRAEPDLAPRPVRAALDDEPPSITMTALPGEMVAGTWNDDQLDALAEAMERLWSQPECNPAIDLHEVGFWRALAAAAARPADGPEREAYDRARGWIESTALDRLMDRRPRILGQGDPQAGNLLYDGVRIRLIDFEDAGASDRCFELANFAEHLGNRGRGLDRLADRFEVDQERLRLGRRLLASFWFFRLLPVRDERPAGFADQTQRLLDLLG
ncbi:MAG TPA: phosphotransferase [Microlunatus sp.]